MRLSEFDFTLPEELIATEPATPRDASRLLVVDKKEGALHHRTFRDLADYLSPSDLLILNETRVIPARLYGHFLSGGKAEVLLLNKLPNIPNTWNCLIKPGRKVQGPTVIKFLDGTSAVTTRTGEDSMAIEFTEQGGTFDAWLEKTGVPPLPLYIKRPASLNDRERYQTVFARENGSVAAPTAGLHFTPELLNRIREKGTQVAPLIHHVGYGTFSPIRTEAIEDHKMHEEIYQIPESTYQSLETARVEKTRVVAVGTTTLRALESLDRFGKSGQTDIFITPGYTFTRVQGLVTNFHLPQSSLFILICAFLGKDLAIRAYEEAIAAQYRFYSYGDAMLIL